MILLKLIITSFLLLLKNEDPSLKKLYLPACHPNIALHAEVSVMIQEKLAYISETWLLLFITYSLGALSLAWMCLRDMGVISKQYLVLNCTNCSVFSHLSLFIHAAKRHISMDNHSVTTKILLCVLGHLSHSLCHCHVQYYPHLSASSHLFLSQSETQKMI